MKTLLQTLLEQWSDPNQSMSVENAMILSQLLKERERKKRRVGAHRKKKARNQRG